MIDAYQNYVSIVDKHFRDYRTRNCRNHRSDRTCNLEDYDFVEEALLEANRPRYFKYVDKFMHKDRKDSMNSSQIMAFDLLLPFFENNEKLANILGIDEKIGSMRFENRQQEFGHHAIRMKTKSHLPIFIGMYFIEKSFSGLHKNTGCENHTYETMNTYMKGEMINEEMIQGNEQLYQILHRSMKESPSKPGYAIVVIPRKHISLNKQYDEFYQKLKHVHQYQYIDRVKRIYVEQLALTDESQGKYTIINDSIIKVEILPKEDLNDHTKIDLVVKSRDDLDRIKDLKDVTDYALMLEKGAEAINSVWIDLTHRFMFQYDLVHHTMTEFKAFNHVIHMKIFF
jgi:hypothetical protein